MDEETGKDFNLLSEENSDVDILLSPASGKSDDDDEVFLGPVRHVEKCVAIGIDLNCKEEESFKSTETVSWSPLNTDQFVEVSREANLLVQHFGGHVEGKSKKMGNKMIHNKVVEQFIEESKLKLALLKGISSPTCPRRETFIVQDSPLRFLPPAIQKSLQVCSSNTHSGFPLQSPKKAAAGIINSSVPPLQNCRNPSLGNNDVACTEYTTLREVPPGEQLTCASTKVTLEKPKPGTGLTPSRKKHLNLISLSDDQSDTTGIISDASDSLPHSCASGRKNGSFAPNQVSQPKISGSMASGSVKKHSAGMAVRTLNHNSSTSSVHSSLHNSASGSRAVSVNIPVNSSKLQTSKNGSRVSAPKSKSSSTCAIDVPKTKLMKPTNTCKLATSGTVNQQGSVMQTLPSKAPSPRTTRPKVTEPKKLLSCSAIESEQKTLRKLQVLCSSSSSEEEISPPLVPCFLDFSPDKPQTMCQEKAIEHRSETPVKENLFIEVSTKIKHIEDRPLIDLSNTPDLKRVASMKAPEPLIDFSSPLIKLSPANKENVDVDSPLLKF
ncbi:G2 and S phase-expressed protein 1 isoform X5 [Scyliorhinus torazame]|uniref:G2 and S phase-expressed protein 1 isoform X5 n=1 Tax=Scyliorhinus torazame TaxID=75743 RepID=UPI003B593A03